MTSHRQLDADIQEALDGGPGDARTFRIELSDHGRSSLTLERKGYRTALRAATGELLGSGGDLARIYLGRDLVAEGTLQRRRVRGGGMKFSVHFVGEKPRPR